MLRRILLLSPASSSASRCLPAGEGLNPGLGFRSQGSQTLTVDLPRVFSTRFARTLGFRALGLGV